MLEAAKVVDDKKLISQTKEVCLRIVKAASEGLQTDGSIIYEKNNSNGHVDKDRHWWPQAETVIGYVNAFELTNDEAYLSIATKSWKFIKETLVDKEHGEWFWSISDDGHINRKDDKAGFWKCPYHNARMCLEVIHRNEVSKS